MEIIKDGKGRGYNAGVNGTNRLLVESIEVPHLHHTAHIHGQAYSIVLQQTPTAGAPFLYIKNISPTLDLCLEHMLVRTPSDEIITLVTRVDGTAAGTAYVPVNHLIGSGNLADATVVVGNTITGLSGGNLIHRFFIPASHHSAEHTFEDSIILTKGRALAFYAVNGSIQVDVSLIFEMHAQEDH